MEQCRGTLHLPRHREAHDPQRTARLQSCRRAHRHSRAGLVLLPWQLPSRGGRREHCTTQRTWQTLAIDGTNHPRAFHHAETTGTATFDPVKLERIARKLDGADHEWFAARSPKRPDTGTPAGFLHELYSPGERVPVFNKYLSQGQAIFTAGESPEVSK